MPEPTKCRHCGERIDRAGRGPWVHLPEGGDPHTRCLTTTYAEPKEAADERR